MPKSVMPKGYKKWKYKVRDVSAIFQGIREFLLGRQHTLHGRFPPLIAPRSIPPADIPRAPEYKYSDQYYYKRSAYDSVMPPVVAPIAEGRSKGDIKKIVCQGAIPNYVEFPCGPPTPGPPWWWDGHFYYECVQIQAIPTDCKTNTEPPKSDRVGRHDK